MSVAYRDAVSADAADLAAFATTQFIEAYREQTPVAALSDYAQRNFTEPQIRAEIEAADARVVLAHDQDGLAGYALVRYNSFPDCAISAQKPAQLQRIYVDSQWQGRGVARELIGRSMAAARAAGCDVLWLAVWAQNPRAIRFYLKTGFEIIGETGFPLGDEVQRDFVMAWPAR